MRKLILTAVVLLLGATAFSQTKVYLIPTLHGLHQTNQQYTYDSLQAIIGRLHPDVLAVELRKEDVAADTAYLKQNYPYEMWMARYWFPTAQVEGFDWLGADLEGGPIPARYWQDRSRIKALQTLLETDSVYTARLAACDVYTQQRLAILETQSLKGILQSGDALLTRAFYDCLTQHLRGSDYGELTQFYDTRNRRMQQHLAGLLEQHRGKTIVILTGDDHYPYLRDFLLKQKVTLGSP